MFSSLTSWPDSPPEVQATQQRKPPFSAPKKIPAVHSDPSTTTTALALAPSAKKSEPIEGTTAGLPPQQQQPQRRSVPPRTRPENLQLNPPASTTGGGAPKSSAAPPSKPSSPEPHSRQTHSSDPGPDSGDDEFVFVLHGVRSTKEAIEKIHNVQNGQRVKGTTTIGGGDSGSATRRKKVLSRRSELPETLHDFYECPGYIVSLVVAREAIFEDALSGFHSLVQREEAEAEAFQQKLAAAERESRGHRQEQREEAKRREADRRARRPSQPSSSPASAGAAAAARSLDSKLCGGSQSSTGSQTGALPEATGGTAESTSVADTAHEEQEVPASLMFLWRSRDEAALRAMSSPAAPDPIQPTGNSAAATNPRAGACAGVSSSTLVSQTHNTVAPPALGDLTYAGGSSGAVVAGERVSTEKTVEEEKLRERQYLTFLKQKELARRRAPEVFRYVYPPRLDFIKYGGDVLKDPHERRFVQYQANHNPDNKIIKEWLYVWEQFERDVHREVLLIEDASYSRADDAIAAIFSYVEYAYDRGRAAALRKLNKLTASTAAPSGPTTDGSGSGSGGAEAATAAAAAGDRPPGKKSFLESLSAAFKDVAIKAHETLPSFMADPLLSASGLTTDAVRASAAYPSDPVQRGRKIFNAVREVVLASQQSFMGFPYQLLCEQVGTERLALALEEYLEEEEALRQQQELVQAAIITPQQLGEGEVPCEHSAPIPLTSPLALPTSLPPVSSFAEVNAGAASPANSLPSHTPLTRSTNVSGFPLHSSPPRNSSMSLLRQEGSTRFDRLVSTPASPLMPPASPMTASRVLRIYHGGADKCSKRKEEERADSPSASAFAGPVPSAKGEGEKGDDAGGPWETAAASTSVTAHRDPEANAFAPARSAAGAPRLAASPGPKEDPVAALRHLEDQRRMQEKKLPLLVGEPRPAEFRAFLDIIRATVEAKNTREDEWKHRQRTRHADREKRCLLQSRAGESAEAVDASASPKPGLSGGGSTSTASPDTSWAGSGTEEQRQYHRRHGLFRADVDGSAYLLPVNAQQHPSQLPSPSSANEEAAGRLNGDLTRSSSSAFLGGSSFNANANPSRHLHGMRIHLYFDPRRNAPVVCVNKVFRLFTVPGLRSFSLSDTAARRPSEDDLFAATDGADEDGRSLLLLIQIEFSLFTQEEAEVRWRWYTVTT